MKYKNQLARTNILLSYMKERQTNLSSVAKTVNRLEALERKDQLSYDDESTLNILWSHMENELEELEKVFIEVSQATADRMMAAIAEPTY